MIAYKTMACWSDLLGFSEQLNQSGWHLNEDAAQSVGNRLTKFASRIFEMAGGYEQGSFINDALIRTLDNGYYLSLGNKSIVRIWLDSCIMAHCMTALEEAQDGLPGVRTIICEGEVLKYKLTTESHLRNPFQQVGAIPTQLNTALSKCAYADQKGSKGIGIKTGGIYIEQSIIDHLIEIFEYKLIGDYLFTYGAAVYLDDVTLYDSIKELYFINNDMMREEAEEGDHRAPWFKLGQKYPVTLKDMTYELVEIVAYSPSVEFSLCWHDCFKGHASGISCSVTAGIGHELLKDVDTASDLYGVFKKYIDKKAKEQIQVVERGTNQYNLLMKVLTKANPGFKIES